VTPRHEGDTHAGLGGDHGPHCAMDADEPCHLVKFALTVNKITDQPRMVSRTKPRIR